MRIFARTLGLAEQAQDLEGAPDPQAVSAMRRQGGDVLAAIEDAPGIRRMLAGNDIDQRGLAGAVRADQAAALARRKTHRQTV
ncbi:MAG: hypothetical protein WDN69_17085 [Aliidongia sp.]